MYFSAKIEDAKAFALGLNDLGEYNEESFIYETEIDETQISIEEDFGVFDALAYNDPELKEYATGIVYNPESDWYVVRNPQIALIQRFKNEL